MPRRIATRSALVLLALLTPLATARAGQVRINLTNSFTFSPSSVQLNQGDQVVYVWLGTGHNAVSGDIDALTPDGLFNSGTLQTLNTTIGTAFTWKSTVSGNVTFFCQAHGPDMSGTLHIQGSGVAVSDFRITEVQFSATGGLDRIEISNLGSASGDLGRYRVSVGTGTQQVVPLNSVVVPAGGRVTIHTHETGTNTATNLFMSGLGDLGVNGSVSLFTPQAQNNALGALSVPLMVDFVEWGAVSRPNEATAITAGFWSSGQFVNGVNDPASSIAFCGTSTDHGSGSWHSSPVNFGSQPPCATPTATTTWGRIKILYR